MLEFNIAPNTQVGRIEIPEKVYQKENLYEIDQERYSRGGEFIENMVTDNIIEFCSRWFHLADYKEFLSDMDELYARRGIGKFSNLEKAGFVESPILPMITEKESPIEFIDSNIDCPIEFINKYPEELSYDNLIKKGKE